jgi:hypothetical protein
VQLRFAPTLELGLSEVSGARFTQEFIQMVENVMPDCKVAAQRSLEFEVPMN